MDEIVTKFHEITLSIPTFRGRGWGRVVAKQIAKIYFEVIITTTPEKCDGMIIKLSHKISHQLINI